MQGDKQAQAAFGSQCRKADKINLPPIGGLSLPIWMVHQLKEKFLTVKSGSWYTGNLFLRNQGFLLKLVALIQPSAAKMGNVTD